MQFEISIEEEIYKNFYSKLLLRTMRRGGRDVMPAALVAMAVVAIAAAQGAAAQPWSDFLTPAVFEGLFPERVAFYSYEAFQAAGRANPAFGTTGSLDDQKRELAAFLGNVNQESGGLKYVREINPQSDYCTPSAEYPCAAGKRYYGRGPIQLSHNGNYGECGNDLGLDLLNNPDLVEQDGTVAWETALWFWMKRGCHGAITGSPVPSFAGTIRVINGGLECGQPAGSVGNTQMENRVTYYTRFCQALGVDPGTDLRC